MVKGVSERIGGLCIGIGRGGERVSAREEGDDGGCWEGKKKRDLGSREGVVVVDLDGMRDRNEWFG